MEALDFQLFLMCWRGLIAFCPDTEQPVEDENTLVPTDTTEDDTIVDENLVEESTSPDTDTTNPDDVENPNPSETTTTDPI